MGGGRGKTDDGPSRTSDWSRKAAAKTERRGKKEHPPDTDSYTATSIHQSNSDHTNSEGTPGGEGDDGGGGGLIE